MKQIESIKEFGGWLNRYQHSSESCQCTMTFSVYLPPKAETERVPVVYWLSGLTCTDDNVRTKAGAQRYASELGIALVMPDTSPRGDDVADEPERYDLGKGAGFYINASQVPWAPHYRMYDYVTKELPALIEASLPVIAGLKSITGHSMGGHGALICALKEEGAYRSVSAFSPICHPSICGWGEGCFTAYLGEEKGDWKAYDTTELIKAGAAEIPLLIDQGTNDEFLAEQLYPKELQAACEERSFPLTLRMQEGYDHSYHFIASFIGEHLSYHAEALRI
ncbi:MAG: S-formylglutathione hydrolase [Candidatus Thiodiazotropha sp. (ex Lucinoma borealis)]|nr:S-formylglutathione hydrolase [Candidatus Thiodiazotropha sp. (ex Lucinoma borealis)]MCU7858019.1 S-formylglutathione hydrolase [Candidatus Thiodiazotropha sp. (ex Lucinoma borealis)]MCU7867073.1 S-formylglutathione hydrolase [Candidatus Thiodiazotropha sp. (ex Lucinoma borealis)]